MSRSLQQNNEINLSYQMNLKNNDIPYITQSPSNISDLVTTDHDNFPYNRYYRGKFCSDTPITSDRQAGYRPVINSCYKVQCDENAKDTRRELCWEAPCSTVYPCYPSYITKYSDKNLLDVMLNNVCLLGSR
jgi:hypothetical protein